MAEPFLGEIRTHAGTYAPEYWAFCNGQILEISQYNALYSLLGTFYGGDGVKSFALPDLRGRVPISSGHCLGSSDTYVLAQMGGAEQVKLQAQNMPAHTHSIAVSDSADKPGAVTGGYFGPAENGTLACGAPTVSPDNTVELNAQTISEVGGSNPLDNMQPYSCINFIIALKGVYPPRP